MNYLVEGVDRHGLSQASSGRHAHATIEAIVLPLLALAGALLLFGVWVMVRRRQRARCVGVAVQGRVRRLVLVAEHAATRCAADAHRTGGGVAGACRVDGDRRRGCAGARWHWAAPRCRMYGRASVRPRAARWCCWLGRAWGRVAGAGRRAAPVPRCQRNDLEPAARATSRSRCSSTSSKARCATRRR